MSITIWLTAISVLLVLNFLINYFWRKKQNELNKEIVENIKIQTELNAVIVTKSEAQTELRKTLLECIQKIDKRSKK